MSEFEYGVNRYGSDIHPAVPVESPEECRERCAKLAGCRAFTYVSAAAPNQPFAASGKHTCWLKDALPAISGGAFCVSGYKKGSNDE